MPTLGGTLGSYPIKVDSVEPGSGGFSVEGAERTEPLLVSDAYLDATLRDLLGDTKAPVGGRLRRVLPRAHPRWPWLMCSRVSNITGLRYTGSSLAEPNWEAPTLGRFAVYDLHLLQCVFSPRPYALLLDASIPTGSITWTKPDGSTETKDIAAEWLRYTDYEKEPHSELIVSQLGQNQFFRSDGSGTTPKPHHLPFSAFPRMVIPAAKILFTWFSVPFRYVDSINSYIVRFQGTINQFDWYRWPRGTLLYNSVKVRRYTPPFPDIVSGIGGASFSTEKLCDVQFEFLESPRTGTAVPASTGNDNWIPAGWNLQPWIGDRKFYYVAGSNGVSGSDTPSKPPLFESSAFELLFQDPDGGSYGLSSGPGYGLSA